MGRGVRRNLWGWSLASRRVFSCLVIVLATMIAVRSQVARRAPLPDPSVVIDPNTAPARILMALPRIGPVLAGRIVAERRTRPFTSIEEMDLRVRGIGPATAAAVRPFLRFDAGRADDRVPAKPSSLSFAPHVRRTEP